MAQLLNFDHRQEKAKLQGGYVETETSRDIVRSLDLARSTRGATMIAGRSGVGKTTTLRQYVKALEPITQGYPRCKWITITKGAGSPWNVLCQLLKIWGMALRETGWGIQNGHDWLVECWRDSLEMLFVDESQYLNEKTPKTQERGATFEFFGVCQKPQASAWF